MTVNELKNRCEELIADGFSGSEVILSNGIADNEEDYFPLETGFSNVVYNPAFLEEEIREWGLDPDNCIVLN